MSTRPTLRFLSLCRSGSLEPDEDPLCMLLLVDHLALRARNYEYLIRLFQEWEVGVHVRCLPRSRTCTCALRAGSRGHTHVGSASSLTSSWAQNAW